MIIIIIIIHIQGPRHVLRGVILEGPAMLLAFRIDHSFYRVVDLCNVSILCFTCPNVIPTPTPWCNVELVP